MPLKWKAQHLMYSSLVFFKSRKFIECLIFHPSHEYIHGFCIRICLHCTLMQSFFFFLMSSWEELTYKLVYLLVMIWIKCAEDWFMIPFFLSFGYNIRMCFRWVKKCKYMYCCFNFSRLTAFKRQIQGNLARGFLDQILYKCMSI